MARRGGRSPPLRTNPPQSTTTCTCGARPPQCVEYVAHVDGDIALELLADGAAAAAARGGGRGGWLRLAIDVMEVMEARRRPRAEWNYRGAFTTAT